MEANVRPVIAVPGACDTSAHTDAWLGIANVGGAVGGTEKAPTIDPPEHEPTAVTVPVPEHTMAWTPVTGAEPPIAAAQPGLTFTLKPR